jgi:hypothetical protein
MLVLTLPLIGVGLSSPLLVFEEEVILVVGAVPYRYLNPGK